MEECLGHRKCSKSFPLSWPNNLCVTDAQGQRDRVTLAGGRERRAQARVSARGHAPGSAAGELGRRTRPPTSPCHWGLQHRAPGRGVGRPERTGREGRHQGRGPDVRRRRDAACVRDSEYVTEPGVLMPAAPPRPSSPRGPQSHRFRSQSHRFRSAGAGGKGPSARPGAKGDWDSSIPPPICGGTGDGPARSRPTSLVCRPL